MRRVLKVTAVLVFVFAVPVMLPSSARAAGDTDHGNTQPKPTGSSANGSPQVAILLDGAGNTVATYRRAGTASGDGGSATPWRCWYYEPTTAGGPVPGIDRSHVATVEVAKQYWLYCDDPDSNDTYVALITWDPQNPFGPLAAGDRAAAAARNNVVLIDPDITTSPATGRPQLVGLPTWLWVDAAWKPRSAAATLGGVTATVTATPATIDWSAGDGTAAFACAGPGPAYDDHHPDRTSSCTHTYTNRSTTRDPNATFALRATITYTVRWQATNGEGGDLDPVTRTATMPLVVREAQAVIE